ncbi:MAG: hypothetical protein R3E66_22265 [bacterium]
MADPGRRPRPDHLRRPAQLRGLVGLEQPEIVELPTLAAGQYYIRIISYEKPTDPLVAADYSIMLESY